MDDGPRATRMDNNSGDFMVHLETVTLVGYVNVMVMVGLDFFWFAVPPIGDVPRNL